MPKERIDQWLKANAWAIIAAALALYGGYITGQTTNESRLSRLEEEKVRLEAIIRANGGRLDDRTRFMACTIRSLDQLQSQHDVTPPCQMELEQ